MFLYLNILANGGQYCPDFSSIKGYSTQAWEVNYRILFQYYFWQKYSPITSVLLLYTHWNNEYTLEVALIHITTASGNLYGNIFFCAATSLFA